MRGTEYSTKRLFARVRDKEQPSYHVNHTKGLPLVVSQYFVPQTLLIRKAPRRMESCKVDSGPHVYLPQVLASFFSRLYSETHALLWNCVVMDPFDSIRWERPCGRLSMSAPGALRLLTSTWLLPGVLRRGASQRHLAPELGTGRKFNTISPPEASAGVFKAANAPDSRPSKCAACTKWYAKQADRHLMHPEDLLHVNLVEFPHCQTPSLLPRSVEMFLGCMQVAHSMGWDLCALFQQLPFLSKVEVVCRSLQMASTEAAWEKPPRCLTLARMLEEIVRESATNAQDAAWLIHLITHFDQTQRTDDLKDYSVLRQILKMALFTLSEGQDCVFLCRVLHLAERVFRDGWQEWSDALEKAGLHFEACAYTYGDSSGTFIEPKRRFSMKGFGTLVEKALRNPEYLAVEIHKLSTAMPPHLAHYTRSLATLSSVRYARESFQGACSTTKCGLFPYNLMHNFMSESQFARLIHFTLMAGSAQTTSLLLAQCVAPNHISSLMRHTRDAGHSLCLKAVEKLLLVSPSERAYVVLRLARGEAPLLFEVKANRLDLEVRNESFLTSIKKIQHAQSEMGSCCLKGIYRTLRDVLPHLALSKSHHSLEALLRRLPITAIPFVVQTFSPLTSELISSWASLYIHAGSMDAAIKLLSCSARRRVFPEMWVLVELLEFHRDQEGKLKSCIELVRNEFAALCPAVFRAFIERTAYHQGIGLGSKNVAQQALELLSSVAILGLSHYPSICIEQILDKASTPTVAAMLEILKDRDPEALRNSPAPLHFGAIERLVSAVHTLGFDPELDVYVLSQATKELTWWSSHGLPSTRSAVHHLYRAQTTGLWPLVFERIRSASHFNIKEVHQAVRLVAVGCKSSTTILEAIALSQDFLLGIPNSSNLSQRQNESSLVATLACVASSLNARGDWTETLRLLSLPVNELPPLLRIVKFQALLQNPEMQEFADINLVYAIQSFVAEAKAKQHACPRHLASRRRKYFTGAYRSGRCRAKLRQRHYEDQAWQSYLPFTRSLRKLLSKSSNNALVME